MKVRQWKAKEVLLSDDFNKAAAFVMCSMTSAGVPYCLVGGLAVGHYSNPVVTPDSDYLVKLSLDELDDLVYEEFYGWQRHALTFPKPKTKGLPRHGVKLTKSSPFEAQVDLISASGDKFLEHVVDNAVPVKLTPVLLLPVITAEDLVVMKSLVGRAKDRDDIEALMTSRKGLDQEYVDQWLNRLRRR